jgi:hypothetical protein
MKKITKNDLNGLTERFPVYNKNSRRKVAGGYVEGWGYVLPEVVVYGYNSESSSSINSFHINGLNWNSKGAGISVSCFK